MKKIFTTILIALLFCSYILAKDYVVTTVKGLVKYETSDGVMEALKQGDTITGETVINVNLGSQLELKGEDKKIHKIKALQKGTVEHLLSKQEKSKEERQIITEEASATMPNWVEKEYAEVFDNCGLGSIKNLPPNKNVVRLCSSSWNCYDIIELTWTASSASIAYQINDWNKKFDDKNRVTTGKKTFQNKGKQEVDKIINLIEKVDFYNQPSYVYTNGRDGETWYVEVNINGEYKSISRWSPDRTFLKDIGHTLYDLAKE